VTHHRNVIAVATCVCLSAGVALAEPLKRGSPAPNFTLPRLDGKAKVSFQDELKANKGKAVLLAVIGSMGNWCKPCDRAAIDIEHERSKLEADGVHVVMIVYIGGAEDSTKAQKFVDERKIGALVLADQDGVVESDKLGAETLPSFYIIKPDATIEAYVKGWTSADGDSKVFAPARAAAKQK
jgi:peroxiredoxin